jgi:hypothetical protein
MIVLRWRFDDGHNKMNTLTLTSSRTDLGKKSRSAEIEFTGTKQCIENNIIL